MNLKQATKLKKAGFVADTEYTDCGTEFVPIPYLEEVLAALGDKFSSLHQVAPGVWKIHGRGVKKVINGANAGDVVVDLYIELNARTQSQ